MKSIDNHSSSKIPPILMLNALGEPMDWITYQDLAFYNSKGKILWTMGKKEVLLRGGINAKTGKQSTMLLETIVAIGSEYKSYGAAKKVPNLTNKTLFLRDHQICAYCGGHFKESELTRDHVLPTSKGGPDKWENVVTACEACNNWKADRTPEQADMPLLYVPYVPSKSEHLILRNRHILADQMEFLMKGVPAESRIRKEFAKHAAHDLA